MNILFIILSAVLFHLCLAQLKNSTSKTGNYAVARGSTVQMSCIPPTVFVDETQAVSRSFVWTDDVGREIVNPRMDKLPSGDLQISHAHESDSGVYHCKFRPLQALNHDGGPSKIFVHKLIVYELSGHKFQTIVAFDVTKKDTEVTVTLLRDLLKKTVCAGQLCSPGPVKTDKCEITEFEKQMCDISMTYEATEPLKTAKCDETCARDVMVERLKKAQKLLETILLVESENPKSRIKPDMQTFETKHTITCNPGYHLIEANYEHCFPCLPGTYSEAETLKCERCPIGFYQEKYGSHNCEQCLDDKTTEMAGSKTRDECRPLTDTGILKDIKEGIASLFKG